MSDCSAKASEQHRTCGACEELYMAHRCNRFGYVMLDENDEPDDDGTTFADFCSLWTPRTEPTLEQRCRQLEQVARDMWRYVVAHNTPDVPGIDMTEFGDRLEALGVSVDG